MKSKIANRIKEVREDNELTLKDFGKKIGFSESIISRYEKGLIVPRKSTLLTISTVFGVNYDWLLGHPDVPKQKTVWDTRNYNSILFVSRVKKLINEYNISIEKLAAKIDITVDRLNKLLKGVREPYLNEIRAIADYFNVNPVWLFSTGVPKDVTVAGLEFEKIPVLGTIAAGIPIVAQEDIISLECVPKNEGIDFALKVKGDSMINARIFDGDIVFVKQQSTVENGEIAVVLVEDEATLKRFYKLNGNVILKAENPTYKDMVFSAKDGKNIKVLGKAVSFKSNLL